jgi:mRNA interferase MazF
MSHGASSSYLRGEVYRVDLNPTMGSEINKVRPCIIIGANQINRARSAVVVVPLSSSPTPRPPIVIPINSVGSNSVAVCDQIRAIDKIRIKDKIGQLTNQEMDLLEESLRQVLEL